MTCFCRGGPTCCKVLAIRAEQDLFWNNYQRMRDPALQSGWDLRPERSESEWQQHFAEYQGA